MKVYLVVESLRVECCGPVDDDGGRAEFATGAEAFGTDATRNR